MNQIRAKSPQLLAGRGHALYEVFALAKRGALRRTLKQLTQLLSLNHADIITECVCYTMFYNVRLAQTR